MLTCSASVMIILASPGQSPHEELMQTVAALPGLQSLTISLSVYEDLLYELDYAAELTYLEVVHGGRWIQRFLEHAKHQRQLSYDLHTAVHGVVGDYRYMGFKDFTVASLHCS